jgi:hypothetical protein
MKSPRNPFEARLRAEGLTPIDEKPNAYGAQSVNASPKILALATEMSAAAHEITDHPALSAREREIWTAYLANNTNWDETVASVRCSKAKLSEVIDRVQYLMLHPDEGEVVEESSLRLEIPPDDQLPPTDMFADIETSLELAAKTAHRVVLAVSQRGIITNDEVKANESAVRTLVLLRRSELEYEKIMKNNSRPQLTSEQIHEIAAKNKVR